MSVNDQIDNDISLAMPGDYFELMKPRVMRLVVFTAVTGMLLAPGAIDPFLAVIAVLAIAIGAGASGALNMWYDADIDAVMSRTSGRPIPMGRVNGNQALHFGMIMSVVSVMTLGLLVNWVAGAILAFTIFFYAVIYTMWLKRSTPQNIVIGGAARGLSTDAWLGLRDRNSQPGKRCAVCHHLHLDAATFLGAGALENARLRQRTCADDAKCGR